MWNIPEGVKVLYFVKSRKAIKVTHAHVITFLLPFTMYLHALLLEIGTVRKDSGLRLDSIYRHWSTQSKVYHFS